MFDLVIRNGLIIDGTGKPGMIGDIAIQGDRIKEIGPHIQEIGKREIDATGKVISPGFIDPHVHEEWVCFVDNQYELFLRQGVTTVVNGNCGHSVTPGSHERVLDYYWGNGLLSTRQRDLYKKTFPRWNDFAGYCAAVEEQGINLNFITLLGHGTLRWSIMGGAIDRPLTEEEERQMESHIRAGMEQGAWGISFGLDYVPSRYALMDELVKTGKWIADYDGVAAAHLRHQIGIKEATEEFVEVGRQSGVKIQVSHLKSTCPEAFQVVKEAADQGLSVLADTIPRSTGHCTSKPRLIQFIMALSDELFAGGPEGVKAALQTKEGRKIIKKDAYIFAGDKSDKFILLSDDPYLEGRSVKDIAEERGQDADECMLDLIADENFYVFWLGGPSRQDFPASGHCDEIMQNPYVCVGTDAIMGDPEDPYDWYELQRRGGFPIFMNMYRKKGVPVEEVIRRNTTMIANHFGIPERGELRPGYYADIVVLDLEHYNFPSPTEIDYHKPLTAAKGVVNVLVNGQLTIDEGDLKKTLAGKVLRHGA